MNYGPEFLKEEARKSAEPLMQRVAAILTLNFKIPLFQKHLGRGATSVYVRFKWPGVVKEIEPETGEVLASSLPRKPPILSPDSFPIAPALIGKKGGRS